MSGSPIERWKNTVIHLECATDSVHFYDRMKALDTLRARFDKGEITAEESGRTTGPHVHFEYRPPGSTLRTPPINPAPYLPDINNYPDYLRRPESGETGGQGGDDLVGRK